jgi:flagellar hook protein FlgE
MLNTIYIGLSGMTAYSKGLDAISDNVANLNTPGFKSSRPTFFDVLFQNSSGSMVGSSGAQTGGAGVDVNTSRQSFSEGELRDTGNPLDAAIDGDGFFVIQRDDNSLLYTRAGQFEFNGDGYLVEQTTGAKVVVTTATQAETTFDLDGYKVYAPQATTQVNLTGTLGRTGSATFDLSSLNVIDTSGGTQTLTAHFVRDASDATKWSVNVSDADGNVIGKGSIQFGDDGTPTSDSQPITVNVTPKDGKAFSFTLSMGAADTFTGVTSSSTSNSSQVTIAKSDGTQLGTLQSTTFDDQGRITLTYTNGKTLTPATLLLAQFSAPDQFRSLGSGMFAALENQRPQMAVAQSGGRGRVVGSKIEMSNVDLTQQFSDLIVIQRGFQASSQMTSVANDMIQQLLQMEQKP